MSDRALPDLPTIPSSCGRIATTPMTSWQHDSAASFRPWVPPRLHVTGEEEVEPGEKAKCSHIYKRRCDPGPSSREGLEIRIKVAPASRHRAPEKACRLGSRLVLMIGPFAEARARHLLATPHVGCSALPSVKSCYPFRNCRIPVPRRTKIKRADEISFSTTPGQRTNEWRLAARQKRPSVLTD